MEFRWNEWNTGHIGKHGVSPDEAEQVVYDARSPYPSYEGDGKFLVCGRGRGGRLLQVVFAREEDGMVYVIHARPLGPREKRRFRKRMSK